MTAKQKANPGKGIFLRGNVYWFRFSSNGKQHFISLQTSDPAEAVKRALRPQHATEFAAKQGIAADVDRFIAAKESARKFTSPKTIAWARRSLALLAEYFPGRQTDSLTASDLTDYVGSLSDRYPETTVMCYMRGASSFFGWMTRGKLIYENPAKGLVKRPKQAARAKWITLQQRDALFSVMEARRTKSDPADKTPYHRSLHFVLFCAFHAGMRFKEIVEARPDWFHLNTATPYIEIQNTDTFTTKNKRSRTVPISAPFRAFLKTYGLRGPYMVEPEVERGASEYRWDFGRPWDEFMASQGLDGVTPHVARHTFASLLVQGDRSLYKVSKWLGNSLKVCEEHYAHLAPGDSGIDLI